MDVPWVFVGEISFFLCYWGHNRHFLLSETRKIVLSKISQSRILNDNTKTTVHSSFWIVSKLYSICLLINCTNNLWFYRQWTTFLVNSLKLFRIIIETKSWTKDECEKRKEIVCNSFILLRSSSTEELQ